MINVSFNKGIFPDFLKVANVVPIHKKGEKLDPNNYRPISLLSNISKLYEKAMHIWLTNFLRKNKVLLSYQFGFRNNYSTNHAFISLTEITRKTLDNSKFACGVFIDLQKAFALSIMIPSFQTKPLQHWLVCSFWLVLQKLSQRQNSVYNLNNERSESQTIKYDVPQGSFIGPLLFLIYINDLSWLIKNSKKTPLCWWRISISYMPLVSQRH